MEHLWDYFDRQVAALSPPPKSLGELEQSLLRVWSSPPISVTDNLIDSLEIQCHQCIQARVPVSNSTLVIICSSLILNNGLKMADFISKNLARIANKLFQRVLVSKQTIFLQLVRFPGTWNPGFPRKKPYLTRNPADFAGRRAVISRQNRKRCSRERTNGRRTETTRKKSKEL
ncbi:DDE_3 domain-containing protein [Trichonephila clavipes]|nr:DDE_3 domain-containing protein [Trichonephila clavipes]